MSQTPRNPFEQEGSRFDSGDPPGGAPARKQRSVWLWVIGIIGVLGVVGVLVCCGGTFLAFRFGSGMAGEQIQEQLRGNPVIQQHIGEIEAASLNLVATATYVQENPGQEGMIFDLTGTTGNAQLFVENGPGGDLGSAQLILPDGTQVPVAVDQTPNFDLGEDVSVPDAAAEEPPPVEAP